MKMKRYVTLVQARNVRRNDILNSKGVLEVSPTIDPIHGTGLEMMRIVFFCGETGYYLPRERVRVVRYR